MLLECQLGMVTVGHQLDEEHLLDGCAGSQQVTDAAWHGSQQVTLLVQDAN